MGGPEPFAIRFDLINAGENKFAQSVAVVDEATSGRLDGIVHCVSYFYSLSPLDFQIVAEWANQYRINTVAPMGLTCAFAPTLKVSPGALTIFVNENHSETLQAYWDGFGASKAALDYLCKVAAGEWERFPGLRANILILGSINLPQRIKSHLGESCTKCENYHDILPQSA